MKEKDEESSASLIAKQTHNDWFNVSGANSKEEKMIRRDFNRLEMVCQYCGALSYLDISNARVGWILDAPQVVAVCNGCGAKHTLILEPPFGEAASDSQAHEAESDSADFYRGLFNECQSVQEEFPFVKEGDSKKMLTVESATEAITTNQVSVPSNTDKTRAGSFFLTPLGEVALGGFQNNKNNEDDQILNF